MELEITNFDPKQATEADLDGYHELVVAVRATDWPDDPAPSYESTVRGLGATTTSGGTPSYLVARRAGQLLGVVRVGLLTGDNDHIAMVHVQVRPDLRRAGTGTRLLRAALPTVRAGARQTVFGVAMEGGSGAAWAAGLGFRVTQRLVLMRLKLTTVDPEGWPVTAPDGYRMVTWLNHAPEELVDSYARARNAIHDAPRGESSALRDREWTPELVREAERDLVGRKVEQRVAVAVHEATGEVAGLTELEFYPHQPDFGTQQDTAVLAAHRGHGLGAHVKAANLRRLVAEHPGRQRIDTSTDYANTHMIEVNRRLGFTVYGVPTTVEQGTADLERRLAS
ncbi:GNAT family N-acetyltransferase [Longispora sp. NPDC051575]|uniref:GNAT family N-acetyltransferase n=1 Tax=Longispora sp. NPDC051575 TaxID=3154943 RepID=UPI003415176D